jgi:hypothetical protein
MVDHRIGEETGGLVLAVTTSNGEIRMNSTKVGECQFAHIDTSLVRSLPVQQQCRVIGVNISGVTLYERGFYKEQDNCHDKDAFHYHTTRPHLDAMFGISQLC